MVAYQYETFHEFIFFSERLSTIKETYAQMQSVVCNVFAERLRLANKYFK